MLKKVLTIVAAIVIIFIVVVLMQPNEFAVSRSITINAPAAEIFPQINNLRKMNDWSPWATLDPNATATYEGPAEGVGSIFKWNGNQNVGEGLETIIESRPNELVKMDLEFIKPFAGKSVADFTLAPQGNETQVTWAMRGKNNFIAKAMSLLMNCDKMMGEQFEKGLNSLKATVENKGAA